MTVNGAIRPRIQIAPHERQFWRIVNASADRYLDLQVDGQTFEIVALDGMPVAYHQPKSPTRTANHFVLSPAVLPEIRIQGWCWRIYNRLLLKSSQMLRPSKPKLWISARPFTVRPTLTV